MKTPLFASFLVLLPTLPAAVPALPEFNSTTIGIPPLALADTLPRAAGSRAPSLGLAPAPDRGRAPGGPSSRAVPRGSAMPVLEPAPGVDYKMLVKAPDPATDFKLIVRAPEPEPSR